MEEIKEAMEILKNSQTFAVVGATVNEEKYGYKIFKALKEANYKVFPINPRYESIFETRCFPSLRQLAEKPDVVVTVIPPEATLKVIEECHELAIPVVWMPPGSWSEEAVHKARGYGLKVIYDRCLIFTLKMLD
ncbi:MAG: CoA-binding protein [Candidatus Aminicenantes bacterium]|nr:CoA-binding protein [Candidatus Aminicenantes bacterium]